MLKINGKILDINIYQLLMHDIWKKS